MSSSESLNIPSRPQLERNDEHERKTSSSNQVITSRFKAT